MVSIPNNRIDWIDQLKGFLLLVVCIGHLYINDFFNSLVTLSHPFELTTFYFLSGYLFNETKYNPKLYVRKKIKNLLIPYISLSILFCILDPRLWNIDYIQVENLIQHKMYPLCHISNSIITELQYLHLQFLSIFFIGISSPITGPLWFVFTLFCTSLLFYFIWYKLKNNIVLYIICAFTSLGISFLLNLHSICLPFSIQNILTAFFFFTIGFVQKKIIMLLQSFDSKKILAIIVINLLIYFVGININGCVGLYMNALGNNFLGLLLSTISGIFFITTTFIFFSKIKYFYFIKGIFKLITQNAIIILAVHYYTYRCCRILLHDYINEPWFPYLSLFIVIITCTISIPIFRNKLYWMIGKEKISMKESLSIN